MCSNYQPIKRSSNPWVKNHFDVDLPDADWKPHTWPLYTAPFVFLDKGIMRCELGTFGLIPHWAQSIPAFGRQKHNARAETVDEKKTYKVAWKERRFGIVLADKFCEPLYGDKTDHPDKALISRVDGEPTAIAAIWESYIDKTTGEMVRSFTMLTVNADGHPFMKKFHEPGKEKRSVVVVDPVDFNNWLNANHDQARELIKLPNENALEYEV